MLSIYACTLLICAASLVAGRAILALLGARRPAWISGAAGFAALVVVSPLLLRLPGRATTAAVIVGLALLAASVVVARDVRRVGDADRWLPGAAAAAIVVGLASLPFAISDHVGVLGEGVYTNDHAAQLYWADWLQHGFGPEPSAVRFGYPIGPQAVAVIAAQVTGAGLVSAFNGLLLAIPALTTLTALGALTAMPAARRIAIAAISGLPYLAAAFLAQSGFKETAMALFVLAFALTLQSASRAGDEAELPPRWRVVVAICLLLGAAAVFTFSLPGLAWFAIAVPLWLALEAIAGRNPVDWGAVRAGIAAQRVTLVVAAVIVIGVGVVAFGSARDFVSQIGDVQGSFGRLSSPVFPGEALSIWPAGDFRIVRGEVSGALLAVALGFLAAAYGAWVLVRDRRLALLAMLITGAVVYVGARAVAEIHVQAKALIVIAPLVLLVGLRALLAPPRSVPRYVAGVLVLIAATASTLLALRDAPVGFDQRQLGLERLAEVADGDPVAFLGVDRFAGYYLRGTLARAPAGYVPEEIEARPEKTWQQGEAADFDSLDSGKLDKFEYAITTSASYASTPPGNFVGVDEAGDYYALWRRAGATPRSKVLEQGGDPGAISECSGGPPKRDGEAVVLPVPIVAEYTDWKTPAPPEARVAGQERGWQAPGEATVELDLPDDNGYALSLQYHSQVPLTVFFDGEQVASLPASLEGMYLSGAGRGAFWRAGEITADAGTHEITVRAAEPNGLADLLNARRLVWLGNLAASPAISPRTVPLAQACGKYVDHFAYDKQGGGRLMPHFGTPDEVPSPVLGGAVIERAEETAKLVFVGGTGRSGTHVLSQLISRHNRYALVPVEVRFHTDPEGFPGLLSGETTPAQFLKRMRGFWWKGFQTSRFRGMYRFVDRERYDAALAGFEANHGDDLVAACRQLFYDVLWFRVEEEPRALALVEQSTDNVARAETLTRVFPEAKFIHVVRDGRDASASRVAQTRGLVRPRTRVQGIEWWEERIRAIERGADSLVPEKLLTVGLDELVRMQRARVALRPLFRFLGSPVTKRTRRYFSNRMTSEEANKERWREGISARKAERIDALYEQALVRLEADGARCAPLLRHALEREGEDRQPLVYVYDRAR